jgi:hypothetical protein
MSFGMRPRRLKSPNLALIPLLGFPVGAFLLWFGHHLGWPGW